MPVHCKLEDTLGVVIITIPVKEKLKFENPPINVNVVAEPKGNTIFILGDIESSHSHNINNVIWRDTEGLPTDSYSLKFLECGRGGGSCGAASPNNLGEAYYALHIVKNGIDIGNKFYPAGFYSASIQSITYSKFGKYTLTAAGNSGNTIIRAYDVEPIYTVACGDCPLGTVRCHSDAYPGYCCLPCEPTKQSIISIKNIVKSVNKEPVSRG